MLHQGFHVDNVEANRHHVGTNAIQVPQQTRQVAARISGDDVLLDLLNDLGYDLIQVGQRKVASVEALADCHELCEVREFVLSFRAGCCGCSVCSGDVVDRHGADAGI